MRLKLRTILAAAVAALAVAHPLAALAQAQVTREVSYEYDSTTGQLRSETVDPGGSHCVRTRYDLDPYGNRKTITTEFCGTDASASFPTRVTVNRFEVKASTEATQSYPAGAFLTSTASGGGDLNDSNAFTTTGTLALARSTSDYHVGFGGALNQTTVALADASRSLTKRNRYDKLGRLDYEETPAAGANGANATYNRVTYKTEYCRGVLGPTGTSESTITTAALAKGCIHYTANVGVTYASGRLMGPDVNGNIAPTNVAAATAISAYFIESIPTDAAGNLIGAKSRVHYDSLHREIAKETQTYSGQWSMSLTVYDSVGLAAASWSGFFGRSAAGAFQVPSEDLMQWTSARDLLHRPTAQHQYWRGSEGGAREMLTANVSYNGLETKSTTNAAANGIGSVTTRSIKNAAGQTAQTIDADGADGATLNSAYDPVGNLVQTVDALGHKTEINYTPVTARFKTSMKDPNATANWVYAYNALGELVKQTDAKGQETSMVYDVLGRLTSKTNPHLNSQWFYDKTAAGAPCAGGLNRLCEVTSGNSGQPQVTRELNTYDALGRASDTNTYYEQQPVRNTGTTYDDVGRVKNVKYPTGFTLLYEYSNAATSPLPGVLVRVSDAASSTRAFWRISDLPVADVFDARGNLQRSVLGNNLQTAHRFDPISGKAFRLLTGAAGTFDSAMDHRYTYDKAHNIASRQYKGEATGPGTVYETFDYDRLNRLKRYKVESMESSANRTVDVTYNAIGNILSKTDFGGYTYNPARPHQVQSAGGVNYAYDPNGHLIGTTGNQTRTNTWTAFNQPERMDYQGKRVEFVYDEDYRRIKETITDGGTQRTITMLHPDNQGGLGYEREVTTVTGTTTKIENRHYISVGGAVVAVVKTLNDSGDAGAPNHVTLYWHKDALGSIVAVSNQSGQVLERMAFDPWGRRLTDKGKVEAGLNPSHGDRGFTGHEHLDEIGLIHMNGRMYDPLLGRFLSPDPFVQSPDDLQNYNRYSYVLNNPLRYTDPSGNFWQIIAVIVGAAMIAEGNKHWKIVGSILLAAALGSEGGLIESGLGNAEAVANHIAAGGLESSMPASIFNAGGIGNSMLAGGLTGLASSGGDLEQGLISAFTAGAFTAAGASLAGSELVVTHAVIGCVQSAATGGKCGPGAMAAGFAKFANGALPHDMNPISKGVAVTLVGGTVSVMGGGKFGNGAAAAAMAYIFNNCATARTGQACWAEAQKAFVKAWRGVFIDPFSPDYATVSGSILSAQGGGAINLQDGTKFASAGVAMTDPRGTQWKPGGSTTLGWIFGADKYNDVNNFLGGSGNQLFLSIPMPVPANAYFAVTHSFGGLTALELGFATPGPLSGGYAPFSHSTKVETKGQ